MTIPVDISDSCGFDYAAALLELRAVMSYDKLAEACGYAARASISDIINRRVIPSHPQGEAIYGLYFAVFNRKPPMTKAQADGVLDVFVRNSGQLATT